MQLAFFIPAIPWDGHRGALGETRPTIGDHWGVFTLEGPLLTDVRERLFICTRIFRMWLGQLRNAECAEFGMRNDG